MSENGENYMLKFAHEDGGIGSTMIKIRRKLSDPTYVGQLKEKSEEEEPSIFERLAVEADAWLDEELAKMPPEERARVQAQLDEKVEAFGDILEETYNRAEKLCDDAIDALDRLEKWVNDL